MVNAMRQHLSLILLGVIAIALAALPLFDPPQTWILYLFYFFVFKISWAYSRAVFLIWSISTPLLLFCCHLGVRKLLRYYRSQGKNIRHAVIVGAGDLGTKMARQMEEIPWAGIEVVGFFDDKLETKENLGEIDKPLIGRINEVRDYLKVNDIDYVYVALPMRAERKIFRILRECRDLGCGRQPLY